MYRPSLAVSLSVLACALGGYAALKPNPPAQTVIQEAPGTSLDELSAFAQRTARRTPKKPRESIQAIIMSKNQLNSVIGKTGLRVTRIHFTRLMGLVTPGRPKISAA